MAAEGEEARLRGHFYLCSRERRAGILGLILLARRPVRCCGTIGDGHRKATIRNSGPQPKQRMMEKGYSYHQAALIENEVYRGLVEGCAYSAR